MTPFAEALMEQLREDPSLRLTAIMELALVPLPARERLMEHFSQSAWPLLHQPCFANIRDIGPWLLSSGERLSLDAQYEFHCKVSELAGDVPWSWLVSSQEPERLANHLGQACIARIPDGSSCLLRPYTTEALPVLYERRDLPGIDDLFAPIRYWWVVQPQPQKNLWLDHRGHDRPDFSGQVSIRLDQRCVDALTTDPLSHSLADQLQEALVSQVRDNCRGHRIAQVRRLLADARKHGLTRQEDLEAYVIFVARHGQLLHDTPAWQAALEAVRDDGHSLAQALQQRLPRNAK